jgi:hypothetical protein
VEVDADRMRSNIADVYLPEAGGDAPDPASYLGSTDRLIDRALRAHAERP